MLRKWWKSLDVGKQRSSGNWNLTKHQIAELAQNFSPDQLKVTAQVLLGLSRETVDNLEWEHRGDQIPFKRSLFSRWLQLNPGPDSAKVSICLRGLSHELYTLN